MIYTMRLAPQEPFGGYQCLHPTRDGMVPNCRGGGEAETYNLQPLLPPTIGNLIKSLKILPKSSMSRESWTKMLNHEQIVSPSTITKRIDNGDVATMTASTQRTNGDATTGDATTTTNQSFQALSHDGAARRGLGALSWFIKFTKK